MIKYHKKKVILDNLTTIYKQKKEAIVDTYLFLRPIFISDKISQTFFTSYSATKKWLLYLEFLAN